MLDTLQRPVGAMARVPTTRSTAVQSLVAGWRTGLTVLNLRGNLDEVSLRQAVSKVLGLELPSSACTTIANETHRLVWVGPDDWFIIGPKGQAADIETALRSLLGGQHFAVSDVSSGYTVLHLSGLPVRDVLAHGCPLDLHPRVFGPGSSAGSLFFKASVWLWQTEQTPVYEMLVRNSFRGYVWLMLERASQACGLVTRRFS
jgi:sarcosine oxidase subunit gamma